MKTNMTNTAAIKICPICGQEYKGASATSRTDNKTPICADCSTRQALQSIGVSEKEQDEILQTIHHYKGYNF